MRITENQHLSSFCLFLKKFIIHHKAIFCVNERILNEFAVMALHSMEKRRIDRRLYNDFVAFVGESHHSHIESADNARSVSHPFFLYIPVVAATDPVRNSLKIRIFTESVAVNIIFCTVYHCFTDEIWGTEIHVGNPHRDDIGIAKNFISPIVFNTLSASTVYYLVEIILHSLIFLQSYEKNHIFAAQRKSNEKNIYIIDTVAVSVTKNASSNRNIRRH